MTNSLTDEIFDYRLRLRFRKDLKGAVEHSQPSWEQLVDMGLSRNISQRSVFLVVRSLLRDVLTGAEPTLQAHRPLLESYVARYKKAEPFEGLPSQTRVHLERLQELLSPNSNALDSLTAQIRELASIYEKDKSRQRIYTVGGLIIGIIGLGFAAYTYFYPYTPAVQTSGAAVAVPQAPATKEVQ